jgi:hypothetical protein
MLVDVLLLASCDVILAPSGQWGKTPVQMPASYTREASAAERLRCVLGMLNSLEVKVLWPT